MGAVTDEDEFAGIMDTNLLGTLRACQVFGRSMIEKRYGRIINIASLSTFVALYEVAAYAASKAAVASLTKSLAIEWAKHGVNVNAIAPGVFRTALNQKLLDETPRGQEFKLRTPMGRFGKVEELAGAARLPGLRRRQLRHRRDHRRRRRLPRQRREPVAPVISRPTSGQRSILLGERDEYLGRASSIWWPPAPSPGPGCPRPPAIP